MLAIVINNEELDLSSDIRIRMQIRNPLFEDAYIIGDRTFPFEFPASPKNKKMLGFPHNLRSRQALQKSWECTLYVGMRTIRGLLKLTRIGSSFQGYLLSGTSLFKSDIKTQSIKEFNYGTQVLSAVFKTVTYQMNVGPAAVLGTAVTFYVDGKTYGDNLRAVHEDTVANIANAINTDPTTFVTATANGLEITVERNDLFDTSRVLTDSGGNDITFTLAGTISWAGGYQSQLLGEMWAAANTAWPARKYTFFPLKNPGFYDSNPDFAGVLNWFEGNDFQGNLSGTAGSYGNRKTRSICPFIYLFTVLDKIFESFDYGVSGKFVEEEEYKELVFYNTVALDMLHFIDEVPAPDSIVNIFRNGFGIEEHLPEMTVEELLNALKKMFNLGFYFSRDKKRLEIIPAKDVIAMKRYMNWDGKVLTGTEIPVEEYTGYTLAFENDPDDTEIIPGFEQQGLRPVVDGDGEKEILFKVATALTTTAGINDKQLVPGVSQPGNSKEFGQSENSFTPRMLLFRGMVPDGDGNNYPYATNTTLDYAGNSTGNYALQLTGYENDGLHEVFWEPYLELLKSKKPVKKRVVLDQADIHNLDPLAKPVFDGDIYFWKEVDVELTLKGPEPATVSLIKK